LKKGESRVWREWGVYPGEPVFVPRPGAKGEDDGVLLSVVLDGRHRRSGLLVLDARNMEEIARASVPHHIPFGFHGLYAS
jgi:carotenoid cleavage dioxygenase-like enzyme